MSSTPEDGRPIVHIRPVGEKTGFRSFGSYVSGAAVERRERSLARAVASGARVEDVPAGGAPHRYWPKVCPVCNAEGVS